MKLQSIVRRNIIANYIGRTWGIISVYLFVPLYLKFLGVEAYGLVGVYSALQGILALADIGLTATLNREMARLSAKNNPTAEMGDLLRTYELLYSLISAVILLSVWFCTPIVASQWLRPGTLTTDEITKAIRLMSLAIAFQLPAGLYNGGLLGLQKQVLTNSIQIIWGISRGFGTVLILWLYSPTIVAFLTWQIISNILYFFAVRQCLWNAKELGSARPRFNFHILKNTWRYALGMTGISAIGIFLLQTDKIILSRFLSLETFGYYTLAGTLSTIPILLANPIILAVFPQFTALAENNNQFNLIQLYHKTCKTISIFIVPAGLTLVIFSTDFIFAWTGSITTAKEAGLTSSLLTLGQVLQVFSIAPFYFVLANGDTRFLMRIQILSVLLITPFLIIFIPKYGMIGGGLSWILLNICILPPYMYFLHKRFLNGELRTWAVQDVAKPLLATLPVLLLARYLVTIPSSRIFAFLIIGLTYCTAAALTAFTILDLRKMCTKIFIFLGESEHEK